MQKHHDVAELIANPALLVDPCSEIVKAVLAETSYVEVREQETQIQCLAAVIDQLTKKGVQLPDGLLAVFVDQCRALVATAVAAEQASNNVHEKEIQLQEIARAADRLEKRGVPIPDVLRSEKMRLAADLSTMVARLAALSEKQNAIVDLSTCFNKQSKRNNGTDPILGKQKTARPRGKSPKTHKNELRQYVVLALQRMGGRGQVSQIIAEMGKLLEGKLLPGDLEWRASAKEFAWQNNTRWEYMALKREGILKSDTPTGIWELNGRT